MKANRCFVDPFHGGAVYDRNGCQQKLSEIADRPVTLSDAAIEPCSNRALISRMLRNLKVIYGRSGDVASLLPIQRRLTALNRRDPGELRDLGVLCVQAERLSEAIEPLEAYLSLAPEAEDAARNPGPGDRDSARVFTLELKRAGVRSLFREFGVPPIRNEIFGTIQESSRVWPIVVDTALAGTRARWRRWNATGSASWLMWGVIRMIDPSRLAPH